MFLTDKARYEDYYKDLKISLDNVLYKDHDGTIYLCPRNFVTDLYSIPNALAWIVGDSAGRDCRPALIHDFICATHKAIKVNLTEAQLKGLGYLHTHYSNSRDIYIEVCEDIPINYLSLVTFSKGQANNILGRAMESLDIDKRRLIRVGVAFNFNYYWNWDKDYSLKDNCYKLYQHYDR